MTADFDHLFTVPDPQPEDFAGARDRLRDALYQQSQTTFPRFGPMLTSVSDVLDQIVGIYGLPISNDLRCSNGCVGTFPQEQTYSTCCDSNLWQEYCETHSPLDISRASVDSMSWLTALLAFGSKYLAATVDKAIQDHKQRCTGVIEVVHRPTVVPWFITLEIQPSTLPAIDPSLTISVSGAVNENISMRLCSIIYFSSTRSHYVSRSFTDEAMFQYDGLFNWGSPVFECTYSKEDFDQLHLTTLGEYRIAYLLYRRIY